MISLYIDTTESLKLGNLNKNFEWMTYSEVEQKNGPFFLHREIYQLLTKLQLKPKEITSVFQVAGPGSYTGMRLSEGLCHLMNLFGKNVFSFYHFEVPFYLDFETGLWISSAFKGEVFCYEWEKNKAHSLLEEEQKFELRPNRNLFCASMASLKKLQSRFDVNNTEFQNFQFTTELIFHHPKKLFEKISFMKLNHRPFYFRPLEKEFRC